jgi:dipeptidyl-peptidase-4
VSEGKPERWEITGVRNDDYERRNVRSFPVYVAPEFRSRDPALLQQCLEVLESNARQVEEAVPAPARNKISNTPIWLEYEVDRSYGGVYFNSHSLGWLTANGVGLAKANSIQFNSSLALMLGHRQNPLLHELAHAYHDLVLSNSYRQIWVAFEGARLSGRYNGVRHSSGRWERSYAIVDHHEFFAVLTEAYFATSDFFPFTRDDLKEFDPSGYKAISDAWERYVEPRFPLGLNFRL